MSRGSLAALLQLAKKLKTRVYITNLNEEDYSFNTMVYAYLYSKMFGKSIYPHETFIGSFSRDFDELVNRLIKYQEKNMESSKSSKRL